jgi:hypothetical protein
MSDDSQPGLREMRARWERLPQTSAEAFIEHCTKHGNAEAITLPPGTILSAGEEPLHADKALLREVEFKSPGPWPSACLSASSLYDCTLREVRFEPPVTWTMARIIGCDLRKADLRNANFMLTLFESTDLRGANLEGADLRSARFKNVQVDTATRLAGANLESFRIAPHTLRDLRDRDGIDRLSDQQRREMRVDDPAADLEADFGRATWRLHAVLLAAFLAPYLYFLLKTWFLAGPCPAGRDCTTALEQLAGYALGRATRGGTLRFATGVLCLAYNTLRVTLIIQGFRLRSARKRGNSAADLAFNNSQWWGRLHTIAKKLATTNIVVTLLHLLGWLLLPIAV